MTDPTNALSFGAAAACYDGVRPSYPVEALRWALRDATGDIRDPTIDPTSGTTSDPIRGTTDGAKPGTVLDLGAGTGLLTRVLVDIAGAVIAVEPDPEMRDQLATATPGVTPLAGSAESIPLPDASVDAAVCGQAYHWFDRERAHPEIARVVRPGGVFAAVWNLRDETVPWIAELTRVIDHERTGGGHDWLHWTDADFGPGFGPVDRATFRHSVAMDADRLLALIASRSYYLVATADKRAELEAGVRTIANGLPATFELPYVTVCYRARRTAGQEPAGTLRS